MNSENFEIIKTDLNRDQIISAVIVHLTGLGLYRSRDILELEIFGLPQTPTVPVEIKIKEENKQEHAQMA